MASLASEIARNASACPELPLHTTLWTFHMPSANPNETPTDASGVVVKIAQTLRDYLESDSRFSPEIAVERVRVLVNSEPGMKAFVTDALQPGEQSAAAVITKLAEALDQAGPVADETVLRLIEIIESPIAAEFSTTLP